MIVVFDITADFTEMHNNGTKSRAALIGKLGINGIKQELFNSLHAKSQK